MSEETMDLTPNVLPIITYPDDRLRIVAENVTTFDEKLKQLILDMVATTTRYNGIGLSGPQVGINKRVIIVILDNTPIALINPIITTSSGEVTTKEGCLSIPGYFDNISRHEDIVVSFQTTENEQKESTATGLLASIIQHEIDHLDGKLFIDRLSRLRQNRAKEKSKKMAKKIKKMNREYVENLKFEASL